ncbi:hypothetical protein P171DRAFT_475794 [Karstenula rhodostoma CBS 690.94]|uniref:Uncharacterized protein n=1 Tax=Karstenula rhodostoma CBS 690.94 TaxID=1392251 RepID=A0A9P4PC43_9PLEO|nr:hypothetical protein P171DRAFT_475794 [Karstenula rhodostoma CBS 690.94]
MCSDSGGGRLAAGVAVIICSQKFARGCVRMSSAVVAVLRWCRVSDWSARKGKEAAAANLPSPVLRSPLFESSLPRILCRCSGRRLTSGHTDGRIGQGPARRRNFLEVRTDDEARSVDGSHIGPTAHETCVLPRVRRARRRDRK